MIILACDFGGTNTRLAKVKDRKIIWKKVVLTSEIRNPTEVIANQSDDSIDSIAIAAAGKIIDRTCKLTNSNIFIDADKISSITGKNVILLNDFEAIYHSIGYVEKEEIIHSDKKSRKDKDAPLLVIGAGTGLGICVVDINGKILPTEDGHELFEPACEEQKLILESFDKLPEWEDFLSGRGLIRIFNSIGENKKIKNCEKISKMAKENNSQALKAFELFFGILGTATANFMLKYKTYGGVYIAGGIAIKNHEILKKGSFMTHLEDFDNMKKLINDTPIYILKNENCGILGAAITSESE